MIQKGISRAKLTEIVENMDAVASKGEAAWLAHSTEWESEATTLMYYAS